jgi:putative flippase GtrA
MELILRHPLTLTVLALIDRIKNPNTRSFIIFFLTAVLGASVNFFSRFFYREFSSYEWSIFWGYLTATVVSFIPQKIFAFDAKSTGNTQREMIKYLIIAFTALGVQIGVSSLAFQFIVKPLMDSSLSLSLEPSKLLKLQETISHVIGMGCSFLANFFGHKYLTFRSTGIYDKVQERRGK